jgi:hypothetical protein
VNSWITSPRRRVCGVIVATAAIAGLCAGAAPADAAPTGAAVSVISQTGSFQNQNWYSNLCLGILPNSNQWGSQGDAVQWTCNGHPDQSWHFGSYNSAGYQQVVNGVGSGQCLSVRGASRSAGARVAAGPCTGAPDQYWLYYIDAEGRGTYLNYNSQLLLVIDGDNTNSGTAVIQYPSNGDDSQHWY